MAQFGLCHAPGPVGHIGVVFCGSDLGRTRRTVPTADRVEGELGWPEIHRTAGTVLYDWERGRSVEKKYLNYILFIYIFFLPIPHSIFTPVLLSDPLPVSE